MPQNYRVLKMKDFKNNKTSMNTTNSRQNTNRQLYTARRQSFMNTKDNKLVTSAKPIIQRHVQTSEQKQRPNLFSNY